MEFGTLARANAVDCVLIEDLRLQARVGVRPYEQVREQTVDLSLEIGLPSARAFLSDDVGHTIDYTAVVEALTLLCVRRHFNLVESLAEEIARMLLDEFGAGWAKVRLRKVNVVPGTRFVGVRITRKRRAAVWRRLLGSLVPSIGAPSEALAIRDEFATRQEHQA